MDDPVSRKEKGEWFNELLLAQEEVAKENINKFLGKTFRVLCDDYGSKEGYMSGHTSGTAVIEFKADESLLGKFVDVKVDSYETCFNGTLIN